MKKTLMDHVTEAVSRGVATWALGEFRGRTVLVVGAPGHAVVPGGTVVAAGLTTKELEELKLACEAALTARAVEAHTPLRAEIVGDIPPALTDAQCVERLAQNGWAAGTHEIHGVVVRIRDRGTYLVCKVTGGDFKQPSLRGLPDVLAHSISWTEPTHPLAVS